jgi:hypothetical protein
MTAVPVTTSRAARRAQQRRDRRRKQVRLIGSVLAVLALVAGAFGVYLATGDEEPPAAEEVAQRTEATLLLQVAGPEGDGVANALLGQDPETTSGAVVLLPPQVVLNVPGSGSLPLGRVQAATAPETARAALSDLVGVTVDHSWTLSLAAFMTLVDALGGIEAEVDVPVVQGQTVVVGPGSQLLDGARAAAFLTFLAPEEQEQSRLARIQQVLDGLLDALPPDRAELSTLLQSFGAGSASSLPAPELAAYLLAVAEADAASDVQYDVLPVIPIDPGGGVTAFRVDPERVRGMVDRLFPDSVPEGQREEGNRVLVLNGVGTPGLGEQVRNRLVPAGFVFAGSRNAPSFGVAETQVLVPEATAEGQALGERVAAALGVPASSVATQQIGNVADVVVLVGADFQP